MFLKQHFFLNWHRAQSCVIVAKGGAQSKPAFARSGFSHQSCGGVKTDEE